MKVVKCAECGKEYQLQDDESVDYFQCECSGNLKHAENLKEVKSGISRIINLKAIIFGVITWAGFFVLISIVLYISGLSSNLLFLSSFGFQFVSGAVAGYFSGKEYREGMINGGLVGLVFGVVTGIFGGIYIFLIATLIYAVLGLIGGTIGVLIYKDRFKPKLIMSVL